MLYGATSLQMNFLERFLPPSGRQTQKRWRGGGEGRERGNERKKREKEAREEREKEAREERERKRQEKRECGEVEENGYEEVKRGGIGSGKENKYQTESERQWVALYRGIEIEYVL